MNPVEGRERSINLKHTVLIRFETLGECKFGQSCMDKKKLLEKGVSTHISD